MRAVVQRVSRARVTVSDETTGEIGLGLLVLLGVGAGDTRAEAEYLVEKTIGLRIFEDTGGKMNLSLVVVGCGLLDVSQFTFYGDWRRATRPSLDSAVPPEQARELYESFLEKFRGAGRCCRAGAC